MIWIDLWCETFEPFSHDIVREINQSIFVTIYYEVWVGVSRMALDFRFEYIILYLLLATRH